MEDRLRKILEAEGWTENQLRALYSLPTMKRTVILSLDVAENGKLSIVQIGSCFFFEGLVCNLGDISFLVPSNVVERWNLIK